MPEPILRPDEALLQSLQKGDHQAFAELLKSYRTTVYRVAYRILRDRGEAEDMVQQVFFEAYRRRASFARVPGGLRTWFFRYAYTRSIDRLRYLSHRQYYETTQLVGIENRPHFLECQASAVESKQLTRLALQSLNKAQRRVIHLSHFEGHSLREIADRTGESLGNIRHCYYRGLKKMRLCLKVMPPQAVREG